MLTTLAKTLTSIGVRVSPTPCSDREPTSETNRAGEVAKMTARYVVPKATARSLAGNASMAAPPSVKPKIRNGIPARNARRSAVEMASLRLASAPLPVS